ncbi:glycosyltransferase family 4 protein [Rhodococcus sp. MS16]|uniref:glycosyltransferase family 4 protein n=1 Tax=Rhodococcus sp. MS16 TaxID=2579941 RepID=UPI0015624EAF|nr:glycosyltransferase family 4 protein [Rhodococcus sp. MS16]NRI69182.1 glycosyltransferase family 4 protein [Rhodococcus sp. MS16]
MVTRLRRNAIECPIVAYVPVEGAIRGGERLTGLSGATQVVAYTPQAADALRAVIDTTVTSIPHAISPVAPISAERRQLREAILPLCRSRSEGTWILNANRNDGRKRPEVTLAAFAEIASLIPSATLLMHCAIRRRGVDLAIERDRLDLRDSVIFTHDHASAPWHVQRLHDLYASCEIGVSSSTGEGWGLIAAEHAQYRAAQIMPAHSGLREIWGSSPQWISPGRPVAIDWVFDGGEPEPRDLAAAMLKLLKDPERAAQIGRACEIVAKQVQYSWQSIGPRWIDLVENLAWGKTNQR